MNTAITNSIKTIFLLFIFTISPVLLFSDDDECIITCNGNVTVNMGSADQVEITPDMVIQSTSGCSNFSFMVIVYDLDGSVLSTSPFVSSYYIGATLDVMVKEWGGDNSTCTGTVTIYGDSGPQITCPPDVTLNCGAETDPSETGVPTVESDDSYNITYWDDVQGSGDCGDNVTIERHWIVTDVDGNSDYCTQVIIVNGVDLSSVDFPPNYDGFDNPPLDCVNPNTDPSFTGEPTIDGEPIDNSGPCGMLQTYTDQVIPICDNSYKILRNWLVMDWCENTSISYTQIIAVMDTTPPVLTCPSDVVAVGDATSCTGTVTLPEINFTDNCSEDFTVYITIPGYGTIYSNGGTASNLSQGGLVATYHVIDGCNNEATCDVNILVTDNISPSVVCQDLTVSLNNYGTASISAISFDDGSYDNCCLLEFEVRRMDDSSGEFGPYVEFDCNDIGNDVMVILQVWDCNGNSNQCMVTVEVQDKLAPEISCPDDVTIDCGADLSNLDQFGEPVITDNCGYELEYNEIVSLDNCGEGVIERTWIATDPDNGSVTCSQHIFVVNNSPWNNNNDEITWPSDYLTNECGPNLEPEDLEPPYNEPVFTAPLTCGIIAVSHTDMVLVVAEDACYKIMRTWTIMDWCTGNQWTHTQILEVLDDEPPILEGLVQDFTVESLSEDCTGTVELPHILNAIDCNQDVSITVSSDFGYGYGPFTNVEFGVYEVNYFASDGCGNYATHSINVTVVDGKNPTPYCLNGLAITLMQNGMIETWASDFDLGSYDNCGDVQVSFSPDVDDTSVLFTCDDVGVNLLEIWITDEAGNQDYCVVSMSVQDNLGVCDGVQNYVSASGSINTSEDEPIVGVDLMINSVMANSVSNSNGSYSIQNLQTGGDYTIAPHKDDDVFNGVSTYDLLRMSRHILGYEYLETPSEYIAADVNKSGAVTGLDKTILRQVILHNIDYFPNNTSWRFYDASSVFDESVSPLEQDFNELISFNDIDVDLVDLDFIGVKIGDISGNAQTSLSTSVEPRSSELFPITIESHDEKDYSTFIFSIPEEDIIGCQFAIQWKNPSDFIYFLTNEENGVYADNINQKDNMIYFSWDADIPISGELFTLVFEKGNQEFQLNNKSLSAEAYDEDMVIYPLVLDNLESNNSIRIIPNPMMDYANVVFNVSNDEVVELSVFDIAGQKIFGKTVKCLKGLNEIEINSANLKMRGVYFINIKSQELNVSKKLIVE